MTTLKPLTVWITTNWKILKEMGIPDHLTCLLRNLYAGQEATVRTRHGTTNWFKIGKEVHQGCILSPAYLTYVQCTSCKMSGWIFLNINKGRIIRYSDDTALMPESEEKLKSLLMKVKEESEKDWFKTQHSKKQK